MNDTVSQIQARFPHHNHYQSKNIYQIGVYSAVENPLFTLISLKSMCGITIGVVRLRGKDSIVRRVRHPLVRQILECDGREPEKKEGWE